MRARAAGRGGCARLIPSGPLRPMNQQTPCSGQSLADAYGEFISNLRIRQIKVCAVLCIVLVPACAGLDYFVYPHLLLPILKVRLLHDAVMIPFLALLFAPSARRFGRVLDKIWAILPAGAICWMIYASEGAVSPYYAGLNLVLIGGCLILPFTAIDAVQFCALVLACYTLACVGHVLHLWPAPRYAFGSIDPRMLINNLYFLTLTAVICSTACYYMARRRYDDFRLRHNLHVSNTDLASTLTRLQETEVQLVQSEKMNALGKLSAGLLHEVNNPLNFTFMALQMAEQEAEGNESLKDTLKDIGQGMERIRGVVSDLRAFAHPTNGTERDPFSVDEALTSALRLCAHEMRDIPVGRKGLEGVRALGSKTQVIHVLMNLLVNAAHATRKKQVITPQISVACEQVNGRVKVSVRDNGSGVKKADLPRLLEPFFTTKEVGQGMGLGLSICHTIVKNHGGGIDIQTEEGEWTQVSFDLPAEPTNTVSPVASEPAPGQERQELAGSIAA